MTCPPTTVVDIIQRVVELVGPAQAEALRVFGHDLLNAYRQWPVKHPVPAGAGRRHALVPHGDVFGCGGVGLELQPDCRRPPGAETRPPLDPLRPLIDDLNGIDMAEFLDLLGLQTKPSKAQKPAKEQVIQRVLVAIGRDGVVLRPTPALWITRTIDDALATNELAPHTAGRLAGRLNFVTQSTFGAVGKAALQPVYARAHDAAATSDTNLSVGLRAAFSSLRALLQDIQPKIVPYIDDGAPAAIIYADAFYQPGEVKHKAGHIPAEVGVKPGTRGRNGWGYVVRIGDVVLYDAAPAAFLETFAARKAFIYVLEILAQVLALVAVNRRLPSRWLAFIDNVAGQWALTKGYGKDPAVNGVLAAFWSTAALADWLPDFRRVPSANVADAISRGDLAMARRMGWTRIHTPVPAILAVRRYSNGRPRTSTLPSMARPTS